MGMMKNNKTVWITGGGTGIGKSVAEQLADLGHNVIISGRRLQNLNKVRLYDSKRITVKVLDICSAKDCRKVVKSIDSKFGSIDLVILNAATYNPGKINFNNLESITSILNINLMGQINCLSTILPIMKRQKHGHIVFMSSPAGYRGLPNSGLYGVTKSALTFLSESLYLELERNNIKVQVVNPGFIKTPMTDKNDFKMPFIMSSKEAATRLIKGLDIDTFEISFPKRLIIPMKILQLLPYSLYFFLMRKLLRRI